jgi:hypothetical protein
MTMARGTDAARLPRARGVEQYPFDPLLRSESVEGLDRLRCISDRSYAATLYEIYILAERNEAALKGEERRAAEAAEKTARVRDRLRQLARRALAGTLGNEAQGLARYVLVNRDGGLRDDDHALAELGRALAELGAV